MEPLAEKFLQQLSAGDAIDDRVAIVAAHPDDDIIMIGAQLPRLRQATVVQVTDGAPRDERDAWRAGLADRTEYARTRRQESESALALAGMPVDRLVSLGAVDQEAALHLVALSRRLGELLRNLHVTVIVTHAFEGGHPDHDAASFVAHAARAILARNGGRAGLVEAPCYHAGSAGLVLQRFANGGAETVIPLTCAQRALKRRMLDAHRSQAAVLAPFTLEAERFRGAPRYDLAAPPNDGRLYYETRDWNMTGARWRELAKSALRTLQQTTPDECWRE
jgi:LmbE family N-acetylglucosaminyl deacetylase